MIIGLRRMIVYLPAANVDSASAAKHRRFLSENRQSRCCGEMKVNFRKRKFSIK
jgi:hypothetical protein